jgi:hypothetical protein
VAMCCGRLFWQCVFHFLSYQHCFCVAFPRARIFTSVRGGGGQASSVGGGPSDRGAAEGDAREGAERVDDLA